MLETRISSESKLSYEKELWGKGYRLVAGVDEVGRGPLAGPVVAACVIFPEDINLPGLDDSKRLSSKKREELKKSIFLLLGGLAGVIATSFVVNWSAVNIAEFFSISETVIGLTVVAIGTSLPEIGTCVAAALRGEGEIAVGNILGADVLNILWIIGVASIVKPLEVELQVINFSFPAMIVIVAVMLILMRIGCRLGKVKGFILLSVYLVYLILMLSLFV